MVHPFPDKPKGMHWRTYERLRANALALEQVGLRALSKRCRSLRAGRAGDRR
jgi:hypothetical protein